MPLAPEVLTRGLAFVRYLYEAAVIQSVQPGFRRAMSVLTFHDAVENLLVLGLQHHDVYAAHRLYQFQQYWGELANANVQVTQQGTMANLNRVRVALKHHALLPAAPVIEGVRVHARDFFVENTPIIFGVNFNNIALSSMIVSSDRARAHMENAERRMAAEKYDEAIGEIAITLHFLLTEYEDRALERDRDRPGFSMPAVVLRVPGFADPDLRAFAGDVEGVVHNLQVAVRILGLGLDFNRWTRFLSLVPMLLPHATVVLAEPSGIVRNRPLARSVSSVTTSSSTVRCGYKKRRRDIANATHRVPRRPPDVPQHLDLDVGPRARRVLDGGQTPAASTNGSPTRTARSNSYGRG